MTAHGQHGSGHQSGSVEAWDERYASGDLVWGAGPNRYVKKHLAELPAGRAVDLACGEGRNAIYLAGLGWQVTGVDFSAVAIDKARALERQRHGDHPPNPVAWEVADISDYSPELVDLAIVIYVHLSADRRRAALRHTCAALRPGGRLMVVGHHTRNIADGVGGPQDPAILYTPTDILDDLGRVAPDLLTEIAAEPLREVVGADRPAIDTLVLARRP